MATHMAYVQYSISALVSLNRLSVLLNFNFFEPRWRRYSTVVMSIVLIGPLLVTYDVFLNEAFYKYNFSANSYYLQSESSSFALFSKLFIFMCVCSPITFIANIVTFVKFHLLPFKPRNLEVQFCFVSLVSSIVQISGTLLTLAMRNATPGTELFKFTNLALPFVSDALSLIQPYALLLFSEPVRKRVFFIICGGNCCTCLIPQSVSRVAAASVS
ncbi:Protein CBG23120 [Caenorhabditis briggsae]|uniref:Serpentine receptor class gamma n=1 Tax=Caenorhabditis briggsae TaxID=6238 RepID=A8Y4N3_CAEBR|nr:Protein CBG23120 [Caenorhabditis briggsae]CAP39853.1 Protein CBG23120 [Caenorhabditis briggsae]